MASLVFILYLNYLRAFCTEEFFLGKIVLDWSWWVGPSGRVASVKSEPCPTLDAQMTTAEFLVVDHSEVTEVSEVNISGRGSLHLTFPPSHFPATNHSFTCLS